MSNKLPLFASAPRAKITINNKKVAYAIGLNLNVSVNLQDVKVLGEFAIQSIEPTVYAPVSGSFQIVRLLSKETQTAQRDSAKTQNAKNNLLGNSKTAADTNDQVTIKNSVENNDGDANNFGQAELYKHLDPTQVLATQSFDIEIKLKVPKGSLDANGKFTPVKTKPYDDEASFLIIKDCRLTSASASISPNQLLSQSLEFQGLLMINQARAGAKEGSDASFKDGPI